MIYYFSDGEEELKPPLIFEYETTQLLQKEMLFYLQMILNIYVTITIVSSLRWMVNFHMTNIFL